MTAAEVHHTHHDIAGGWLRPAVFGVMDGLVSNLALISGFAGGAAVGHTVLLAGLAGLVSGSTSMAIGEYTSVRSQGEAMRAEVEVERRELERSPAAEATELAGVFRRSGLSPALAVQVAAQISREPETALRIHVREELGFNPDELPSPLLAGAASFLAFGVGALVPLFPYLLGARSFLACAVLSAFAMFGVGLLVSRFTRRPALRTGLRQLALGAVAAGATFLLGAVFGTAVR